MCGIKMPLQDFALKMQGGGLMREGGRICGTLRYICLVRMYSVYAYILPICARCNMSILQLVHVNQRRSDTVELY